MKPVVSPDVVETMLADARANVLSRRDMLRKALALGLTAPVIAQILAACGGEDEATEPESSTETTPTTATGQSEGGSEPTATVEASETDEETPEATRAETSGGDDATRAPLLRILQWQAPTMLNPHLATGYKDFDAARIAYEPLADFDVDGNAIPVLAEEFPTLENGGVAEDGRSVTWKLRQGVTWQDGEPFSSADVKFTWEYASDPETGAATAGHFSSVETIETPDDHTVVIQFTEQNPAGFEVFTGRNGMIIPAHIFSEYMGDLAREAPVNLMPLGTGPYRVTEFRPGDVALYDRYDGYWDAPKPYFEQVELKGGGDSLSTARAVLQTGEADWAWGAGGEQAVMAELEKEDAGVMVRAAGIGGDRVAINFANPNEEVDGAFSEPGTTHPLFQYKEVRNAIALAIPRDTIVAEIYGVGSVVETNNLAAPTRFASPNTTWEYNLEEAQRLLDEVGVTGGTLVYQTSISANRQRVQDVVKQNLEQLGFEVELKIVDAATFFSADTGNPDTYTHFYADLETFTFVPGSLYPIDYMRRFRSDDAASQANDWTGPNVTRYQNPEYDALHDQARVEMDPARQEELFIQMNDISVNDFAEIPIVNGGGGAAAAANLTGYATTPWTSNYHDIANWRIEG